jgi:hypothetical protein
VHVLVALLLAGFGLLPFLLAWEPAAASSNCAKLEDDINDLYLQDPAVVRALNVLKGVQSLNKQQGLGFVAGGQVVTKRTLWMVGTGIYSALVVFGPTLEGELGLEAACGGAGGGQGECPFGWTFADGACFQIFGDEPICTDLFNDCCAHTRAGERPELLDQYPQWADTDHAACAPGYTLVGDPQSWDECSDSGVFDPGNVQPNYACEWTGPQRTVAEEIKARMGTPLGWAEAEEACLQLGDDTHLASVTSAAQQTAVARLAKDQVNVW